MDSGTCLPLLLWNGSSKVNSEKSASTSDNWFGGDDDNRMVK